MDSVDWGKRIRAYRKLKGYTQVSFAKALGKSVSIIGEIERGARFPSENLIEMICHTLNITIDELIPEQEKES
jgi:transcriptional regulator with XRE-family HTH domain